MKMTINTEHREYTLIFEHEGVNYFLKAKLQNVNSADEGLLEIDVPSELEELGIEYADACSMVELAFYEMLDAHKGE